MLAAYLLEPQRRTYELVELAADAGIGLADAAAAASAGDDEGGQLSLGEEGEAGLEPPEEARLVVRRSPRCRGRGSRSSSWQPLLDEVELPLVHVLAAMEREGLKLDAERLAEVGAGFGERIETTGKRDLRAGGRGVHDRLAAAGRRDSLREARADPQAPGQDGLLHRRPGPRADPRRASDRREDRGLAGADQAQEHLSRLAARPDRPADAGAFTRLSTRPRRRPAGSPAPIPTCRTSRSAPRSAAPFAPVSSPNAARVCSRPTTARSSCGSSRTSRTRGC